MRNDKNAYARRHFSDRYKVFFVKREVLNGVGVRFGLFYALRDIAKGLIPGGIVRYFRKKGII